MAIKAALVMNIDFSKEMEFYYHRSVRPISYLVTVSGS